MNVARRVFFSFHYKPDNWRASQVRNMGALEGNQPVADNDWEAITSGGDRAIKAWIERQMDGRSCALVLIGSATAGRKWITYEIQKAWDDGRGVFGIHIHNLKDINSKQSSKGANPFTSASAKNGTPLSSIVKVYDPPYTDSTDVYNYIKRRIEGWVEDAIALRKTRS